MTDRWKMNRMGFVNFWLYDEEIFSFEDGRLLLRGQNGSGKSITTQSFIPFILDGDRTPSRLDPFGSSDRRMEYYFLGEDGKNESTGYLFLEFHKPTTGQYRTIAIGQRARRGKPMDFWGFVVQDGRRIGQDFQLYREVGSSKIPCTRQEIRKILGDQIPFAENPKDYKELVNKYIFGFRRLELYDQFIRLLVKVRAPKLSKEFRPTKVYEILNESLQTLSDDDMRPMVDAMEKMDSIQENLEMLRRALKDASALRVEYTRYNQYFLAKKAEHFLEAAGRYKALLEEQQKLERQEKALTSDLENALAGEAAADRSLQIAEAELAGLRELDDDLNNTAEKLSKVRMEEAAAAQEEKNHRDRIAEYQGKLFQADQNVRHLENELEMVEDAIDKQFQEMDEIQEELQWEGHDSEDLRQEKSATGEKLQKKQTLLKQYTDRLRQAKATIEHYEQKGKAYDVQLKALEEARLKEDTVSIEIGRLQEEEEQEKEKLIAELYSNNKKNSQLIMKQEILAQIEEMLLEYSDLEQASAIAEIFLQTRDEVRSAINLSRSSLSGQLTALSEDKRKLEEELHEAESREEYEPERKNWKEESRKMLRMAGIPAVPLFQALEFEEGVSEEEQSKIENILSEAGLLDALVIPERYHEKIKTEYPEFADSVIFCETWNGDTYAEAVNLDAEALQKKKNLPVYASCDLTVELKAELTRILPVLCGEVLANSSTGEYRHGLLYGRVKADGPAVFVGVEARKRERQKRIEEIRQKIAGIQSKQDELKAKLYDLELEMRVLQEEYDQRITLGKLNQLLSNILMKNVEREALHDQRRSMEKLEEQVKSERDQAYQLMLGSCREFPYERTKGAYEEALSLAEDYDHLCRDLVHMYSKLAMAQEKLMHEQALIQMQEDNADYENAELRKVQQRRDGYAAQIRQYLDYLNQPERIESARRIQRLQDEIKLQEESKRQCQGIAIKLQTQLEGMEEQKDKYKKEAEAAAVKAKVLKDYYSEELGLGLIHKKETEDMEKNAAQSIRCLRESDKNKTEGEMTSALFEAFHRHSSNLTNYAVSLVDCFEEADSSVSGIRRRKRIRLIWLGQPLYLEGFFRALNTAIEDTELLIQEKDRELFENILSQTISQQLTERIDESRKWVKAMSGLMKKMDTSMGLHFSLEWKARSAEAEEELDIQELETLLLRSKELLTNTDIEKVAKHFRSRVRDEKRKAEEAGMAVNYMDLVRDVLDYRRWFAFQMFYVKGTDGKKPLTNAAFNRFSGGEKAMAMYVPLFAAVNAQYQKATKEDHPRMIALDEAFAGVDDKNIDSMFELVEKLDFDYIMNSQALWGCYESVKKLRITELIRPRNSTVVSLIHYIWNGHEKVLDL